LGDPVALREVLVNLLFNAFDALPAGGAVSLAVRGGRRATDGRAPEWVELDVADTGTGIPAEIHRRIFEPFFTTKGDRGSGLGLAMVRKVVEAHGGTVAVESSPGQGTTFRLRLPPGAGQAGPAPAPPAGETVQGLSEEAVPPLRIVLVDDQQDVLDTVSMLLRRDGHDVRAFRDPHAAVDGVLAEPPDVLLTDLGMPGLSGWDVARLTRERWPDLPIVLLTGWGRDVSAAQLREHGVLLALAKPFEPPTLRGALARALRPAPAAPLRILLVDDATAFATVLGVLLTQGGHQVHRVERAGPAVELLAGDEPVDLVILDLHLPDLPSVEVLRAAQARPHPPAVCVVSGSDARAMQSEVPGADLYVEKAYVPEQLERLFALALARQQSQRPLPGEAEGA
jgi:CheY-like chemotaxis protein